MDYKVFAGKIHKSNNRMESVILLLAAFIFCSLVITDSTFSLISREGTFFIIIFITWDFISSYMKFYDEMKKIGDDVELSDIAGYHCFDLDRYFNLITRRLLPIIVLMITSNAAAYIIYRKKEYLIGMVLSAILPFAVITIRKKILQYRLCHRIEQTTIILVVIIKSVLRMVKIWWTSFYSVIVAILVYESIYNMMGVDGMDGFENEIAYKGYMYASIDYICFIVLGILTVLVFSGVKGRFRVIRTILAVGIVAVMVANFYVQNNNNIIVAPDDIILCEHGERTKYSYNDVESYKIYYDDSMIKLQFAMNDGKCVDILYGTSTYTDAFSEEFHNDYDYVAYMVKKMSDMGIQGELSDRKELLDEVEDTDKECKEAMAEILEYFQDSQT